MELKLTVYADETMEDVKRICSADTVKIPYRVAASVISSLDEMDLNDEESIIKYIAGNVDKMEKIVKATFHVSEAEMDCINIVEMAGNVREIYRWVAEKVGNINTGNAVKNAMAAMRY